MVKPSGADIWPHPPVCGEKEDAMWIVYLVVGLVGVMFVVLSLLSLEAGA